MAIPNHLVAHLVRAALQEDLGPGDLTTEALIPSHARAVARIVAGEPLVPAGLQVAEECFRQRDRSIRIERIASEGDGLTGGACLLRIEGATRGILEAERTALNFLARLSGIATLTRRCVEAVEGTRAVLCDTRKTTPGWRALERHAVRVGGGVNHRFGLFDAVLVKDNHLAVLGDPAGAVARARARWGDRYTVTVEVDDLEGLDRALAARPDVVLLDNMTPDRLREAVRRRDAAPDAARILLEASGGITPERVAEVARCGVDRISLGAITRAPAVDLGLECRPAEAET